MHIHNEYFAPNYLQWNSLLLQLIPSGVTPNFPFSRFLYQFARQQESTEENYSPLRSKETASFILSRHFTKLQSRSEADDLTVEKITTVVPLVK